MEEKKTTRQPKNDSVHNLILENRKKLSISGIEDVESFNEEEIVLATTSHGILVIKGSELHITKLSVDSGDVSITGEVCAMDYMDRTQKSRGGFISKLLR